MSQSIVNTPVFTLVTEFYTCLGAGDCQGMVDAMMAVKDIDYDVAVKMRVDYRAYRAAQTEEGYQVVYSKILAACEDHNQAKAAGYISVVNTTYPQKFGECKALIAYYFPKKK